jgi:hypothetical protein
MQPLLAQTQGRAAARDPCENFAFSAVTRTFRHAVRAIRQLLSERWDEVHPRARTANSRRAWQRLRTLDDLAPVIFPLQYAALVSSSAHRPVSYRSHMIATGEVSKREGEDNFDLTTIEKALMEVDLAELVDALGRVDALGTALADIRNVCTERAGFEQAMKLERLPALVDKMRAFLNGYVARRDPSASLATEATAPSTEIGRSGSGDN